MITEYYVCDEGHAWQCDWSESVSQEERWDCCPECIENSAYYDEYQSVGTKTNQLLSEMHVRIKEIPGVDHSMEVRKYMRHLANAYAKWESTF